MTFILFVQGLYLSVPCTWNIRISWRHQLLMLCSWMEQSQRRRGSTLSRVTSWITSRSLSNKNHLATSYLYEVNVSNMISSKFWLQNVEWTHSLLSPLSPPQLIYWSFDLAPREEFSCQTAQNIHFFLSEMFPLFNFLFLLFWTPPHSKIQLFIHTYWFYIKVKNIFLYNPWLWTL